MLDVKEKCPFIVSAGTMSNHAATLLMNGISNCMNQSYKNVYIKSVMLNGKKLEGNFITHNALMNGGTLVFEMSSKLVK